MNHFQFAGLVLHSDIVMFQLNVFVSFVKHRVEYRPDCALVIAHESSWLRLLESKLVKEVS